MKDAYRILSLCLGLLIFLVASAHGIDRVNSGPASRSLRIGTSQTPASPAAAPAAAAPQPGSLRDARPKDCTFENNISAFSGMSGGSLMGDMASVLFEYQKLAGKEAREDDKTAQQMKKLAQQQKSAKLADDNRQIGRQMQEADRKAQILMDAATTQLILGIVASAAQISGGVGSGGWSTLSATTDHSYRQLTHTSETLKRDLIALKARLTESYEAARSGRGRLPSGKELDQFKEHLDKIVQHLNKAREALKPCP